MPKRFDYYANLTRRERSIYDRSDAIAEVPLGSPDRLRPFASSIRRALAAADRTTLQKSCRELVSQLAEDLSVPAVEVRVLKVRPSDPHSELHGTYEVAESGSPARIEVWMRTAARRQVVAFRTFLRTLIHEFCHHLDYELFDLPETFHTQGFFQRESSLFRQVVGETDQAE